MERLTIRNSEGIGVLRQPYQCERCGDLQWSLPDLGNGSPIDRLAEYEDLEEQGKLYRGWIPCSERLPEESLNSVIGWDEYRERCCFVQYYSGKWHFGNDDDPVKIIAWQSVPEPYKPEKEHE